MDSILMTVNRICILILLCGSGLWAKSLTLQVLYPYEQLEGKIYLRGNDHGLSWDRGQAMSQVSLHVHQYILSNITSFNSFDICVFMNDSIPHISGAVTINDNHEFNRTIFMYPSFKKTAGIVHIEKDVYSPQLNNSRSISIYLPPSYYENRFKVYSNVLIAHDGQNLFNGSTARSFTAWNCHKTLDQLILTGKIEETVIIGISSNADRPNELPHSYDPNFGYGGKAYLYLDFIEDSVLPLFKSKYRLRPTRESLGILGASFGGINSCYAIWTRYKTFGLAGCLSSSFWWNNEDFDNILLKKVPKPKLPVRIYLDSGDAGKLQDNLLQTIRVRDSLLQLGFKLEDTLYHYVDNGADHHPFHWGRRFSKPIEFLFPRRSIK